MTNRENFLSIARRTGYDYMPVHFEMCPSLTERYNAYVREHELTLPIGDAAVRDLPFTCASPETFREQYYGDKDLKPGTYIDPWGVAHEPGSAAAYHMTYMHHPMESFDSVEQILAYPMPVFQPDGLAAQTEHVRAIHAEDRAAVGYMQVTIWETAWYMRGMENLMCDLWNKCDEVIFCC